MRILLHTAWWLLKHAKWTCISIALAVGLVAGYQIFDAYASILPGFPSLQKLRADATTLSIELQMRSGLRTVMGRDGDPYTLWTEKVDTALDDKDLVLANAWLEAARDVVPPKKLLTLVPEDKLVNATAWTDGGKVRQVIEAEIKRRQRPDRLFVRNVPGETLFLPGDLQARYMSEHHGSQKLWETGKTCLQNSRRGQYDLKSPLGTACTFAADLTPFGDGRDLLIYSCAEWIGNRKDTEDIPAICGTVGRVFDVDPAEVGGGHVLRWVVIGASAFGLAADFVLPALSANAAAGFTKAAGKSGRFSDEFAAVLSKNLDDTIQVSKIMDDVKAIDPKILSKSWDEIASSPDDFAKLSKELGRAISKNVDPNGARAVLKTLKTMQETAGSAGLPAAIRMTRAIKGADDLAEMSKLAKVGGRKALILAESGTFSLFRLSRVTLKGAAKTVGTSTEALVFLGALTLGFGALVLEFFYRRIAPLHGPLNRLDIGVRFAIDRHPLTLTAFIASSAAAAWAFLFA